MPSGSQFSLPMRVLVLRDAEEHDGADAERGDVPDLADQAIDRPLGLTRHRRDRDAAGPCRAARTAGR